MKPYIHITLSENRLDHFLIKNLELCSKEKCKDYCVYHFEADCSNNRTWEIKKDDENKPILYYDCVEDIPEIDDEDRHWRMDSDTETLKYFFSAAVNPDGSPRHPREDNPMPWLCSEDDDCKNADQNYINTIIQLAQNQLDEYNQTLQDKLDPTTNEYTNDDLFSNYPERCTRWVCLGPANSNHPYLSIKKCRKFHTIPQDVLDSMPSRDDLVAYRTEQECKDNCGLQVILHVRISEHPEPNLEFTIGKLPLTATDETTFSIPVKQCDAEDPAPPYEPNTYVVGDVLTDVSFPESSALTFKKASINYNAINTGNIIIPITNCTDNSTPENKGLDNTEVMDGNAISLICSAVLDNDGLKFVQIHIPGSIFDDIIDIDTIQIPLVSCSNIISSSSSSSSSSEDFDIDI